MWLGVMGCGGRVVGEFRDRLSLCRRKAINCWCVESLHSFILHAEVGIALLVFIDVSR